MLQGQLATAAGFKKAAGAMHAQQERNRALALALRPKLTEAWTEAFEPLTTVNMQMNSSNS